MIVKQIKLVNFRNYETLDMKFTKGIHFFIGKNGQGKTNLLESMFFLSCTKSHRTNQFTQLIRKNEPFSILECIVEDGHKIPMKIVLNPNGKNLFLYNDPIPKVSSFIGMLNAVMFCPDDIYLFHDTPKKRRKFIDLELGKISKTYTHTLNTYYKLLKDRNAYLKSMNVDREYVRILDDQMIHCEVQIIHQRKQFIDKIMQNSIHYYTSISEDQTNIQCIYKSFVEYDSISVMKQNMKQRYEKDFTKDCLYKQTSQGIHKDDFIFMMNGYEAASYASQGQKRSFILALKLSIIKTIQQLTSSYPILLLDDVFSELDAYRREKLLSLLDESVQVFISATDKVSCGNKKDVHYYVVNEGIIEEYKED